MASIDLTVKVWFDGFMRKKHPSGQVGLLLLVVMGIVISIVLSVAARSLSDIALSRQERENSSSFALAETGVEEALRQLSENPETAAGGNLAGISEFVSGSYTVGALPSYDLYVKEGETAEIDLTGSPSNVVVSWVKEGESPPGPCTEGSGLAPASLEITLVDASNTATRAYYNADGCNLAGTNGFAAASAGSGGYSSSVSIANPSNYEYMRIKPLYNGTTVNVTGDSLVSQLYLIQSKASGGDVRTDIEAKRSLSAAGSIFDYALFSETTIIK